jgi:exopolyphosphatase/guanosine-5'-triphosphate,3'-diphosphate pyrophosphatase
MEAKRVDMILAGAILLEEAMGALGAKRCITTEYSLRDGILQEELQLHREHRGTHIGLHLPDLYLKAERLGASRAHLDQVVAIGEQLFDRLRPLHRLAPDWKSYLTAAAILHDVGEAVTPTKHEAHSYYIVKHADFPSMEKWETEFVAQLCRWHASGRPEEGDLDFGSRAGGKDRAKRREAFFKLLALLRVADALDRGHRNVVRIARISNVGKGKSRVVRLRLTSTTVKAAREGMDLELLRIEQKKALFEQVFDRKLEAIF